MHFALSVWVCLCALPGFLVGSACRPPLRLLLLWHWQPPWAAPLPASPPLCLLPPRRSVVETIKIVTETLEALFNMRLAIPAGVVRCLTEGVDNALQK